MYNQLSVLKKSLLFSASFLLLLFYSSTLPLSALAAPSAYLSASPDRHYVYLTFSGLKTVSKVAYTLMYDTAGRTTGLEGGLYTKKATSRTTRRQILGTCSTQRCTYHKSPKNMNLQVTFYLRSGGTTTLTRSLP